MSVDAAYSVKKEEDLAAPIPNRFVRRDGFDRSPKFEKTKRRCQFPGFPGFPKSIL